MDAKHQSMGLLIVGAGFLGGQRAAAAVAARGVHLAGVMDREVLRAEVLARRHHVSVVHSLADALRDPAVDAVVIATPPNDHAEIAHQALEAGKHVLCEKPLAVDPDDARSLATHADHAGLTLATGLNHRFYPPVRDALRLVSAWAIGRVESVRVQIGHKATRAFLQGWHTDLAISGGGTLMDNGPHACDLIRLFLGEIIAAQGFVRDALELPSGCESEAYAHFRSHDDGIAELRSSWTLERGYLSLEIRGSSGYLFVDTAPWSLAGCLADGRRIAHHYVSQRIAELSYRRLHGCEHSFVTELEAFVMPKAAHTHPRPNATGWDGARATEMIAAVYDAARSGNESVLKPPQVRLPHLRTHVPLKGVA
jgi:predicted dehydrogenase